MSNSTELVEELKKYNSICLYPSSGTDLSDLDYFSSGCKPREERLGVCKASQWPYPDLSEPDVFVHTDVNFYIEFEAGEDFDLSECGIHGPYEILGFEELKGLEKPNRINNNLPFTGKCFKYTLKLWERNKPVVLIFCLCENEAFVSEVLLKENIKLSFVWSKNWNGGRTYGTWLARIAHRLGVKRFYTDWLCVPDLRGEPSNIAVAEKYPELMIDNTSKLLRTDNHWIEEGAHGWVDEFTVHN